VKVVAVSQRVDEYPNRGEFRDSLDQKMVDFVANCDAMLIPVPNFLNKHNMLFPWLNHISPNGIILSGGEDIGSCLNRDDTEETLLRYCESKRLPLLGICRGAQVIGVRAGSKIKKVKGHVAVRHRIKGEITGEVNSFHSNVLTKKPKDFSIIARSIDNEIEAIRHNYLPWEGWMWHPEREMESSTRDINRLKALLT